MADAGDKRKRKAKYISFSAKRQRSVCVPIGRQGFFITCDGGREQQCARECVNLLDQFFEKFCSEKGLDPDAPEEHATELNEDKAPEKSETDTVEEKAEEAEKKTDNGEEKTVGGEEKNIDDLLAAEIAELRDKNKARFVKMDTGCNGVVFIDMARGPVRPTQLAEYIVRSVAETKKSRTRFCMKLLPIEATCHSSAKGVKDAVPAMIARHFPAVQDDKPGLKFAVVYESRANTGLDRMTIINAVAELVPKPHSVDLKSPDKTIIVQVIKTTCTVGIVNGYKEFSKYNLRQLLSTQEDGTDKTDTK